jgi:UDP-N-acetylmuramate dehydrogenase
MTAFRGLEHIVREQQPLAPYNWFRLGGPAEYFAEPTSLKELTQLVRRCADHDVPVRVIGGGSRVLIPDQGVAGLIIQLSAPAFSEIVVSADTITAGGGTKLGHLVSTAVREGLAGLESLVGIPGTVAGALRGNADSYGSSIGHWTTSATVLTRQAELRTREQPELRFSYGESSLDELVILSATFKLEPGASDELTRKMQKLWIVKRTHQPTGALGTGRVFKDPQGLMAAELIEQAGLRGQQVGEARVSDASANFIEVTPGATSEQVKELIDLVRTRVASELGVELECELEIW